LCPVLLLSKLRSENAAASDRKVMNMRMFLASILCGLIIVEISLRDVFAQSPCDRFPAGSTVTKPEDLYSRDGVLEVEFTYQTAQDSTGKI
jgi:hypothetical protein